MTIDQAFFHPRTPVAVVAIGEASEAFLVRAILESLGAAVSLHLLGTPHDFLQVVRQGSAAPGYIVICGHGDERGLVFGEYGEDIDVSLLDRGSLPPSAFAGLVDLPGKVVVSTACATGTKAFKEAFVQGGVSAYVAPSDYPEGADAGLFIHILFYQLLRKNVSVGAAVHKVQSYDPELTMFGMFVGE